MFSGQWPLLKYIWVLTYWTLGNTFFVKIELKYSNFHWRNEFENDVCKWHPFSFGFNVIIIKTMLLSSHTSSEIWIESENSLMKWSPRGDCTKRYILSHVSHKQRCTNSETMFQLWIYSWRMDIYIYIYSQAMFLIATKYFTWHDSCSIDA